MLKNKYLLGLGFLTASLLAFLFAFLRVKFYEPVDLVLEGRAVFPGRLHVEWNSGKGFNILEKADAELFAVQPRELILTRTGQRNQASRGDDVWLQAIETDSSEKINLEEIAAQQLLELDDFFGIKIIKLTEKSPRLVLKSASRSLKLSFLTNDSSGFVKFSGPDIEESPLDLFSSARWGVDKSILFSSNPASCLLEPCRFRVRMSLSPERIEEVRIKSTVSLAEVGVALESNKVVTKVSIAETQGDFFAVNTKYTGNERLNWVLVATQVFFSVLVGLISLVLLKHAPLLSTLLSPPLNLFWVLWGSFFIIFCFWWFSYWPVAFTPDSLFTWRTAKRLYFYDDSHPFLNVFYVLLLRQLWDNPAVISLFQITITSGLAAAIFSYCRAQGVNRAAVYLPAVLFAFSIPVGLYSITLWRDTPFALLLVFWAFLLVVLKDNPSLQRKIQLPEILLLSVTLIFLMLRHNGKLSLALLPLMVLFFRLLPWMKGVGLIFITTSLYYLTQVVLKFDILQIHFLYPQTILQSWKDEVVFGLLFLKFSETVLAIFNALDINMHWRETNIWNWSWGGVLWAGGCWINGDVEAGFIKYQSLVPSFKPLADFLVAQSYKVPFVFLEWNLVLLLYLFILPLLFFWRLPRAALFAVVVVSQTFALIFFTGSINWRYFYYQCFACYFIVPILLLDQPQLPKWLSSSRIPRSIGIFGAVLFICGVLIDPLLGHVPLRRELARQTGRKEPLEISFYLPYSTLVSTEFIEPDDTSLKYFFDAYGMRAEKPEFVEPSQDARRILLLGDEVLFGRGVEIGSSVVGRLRDKTPQFPKPLYFFNAALTGGGSPDSYYAYLRNQGLGLKPSLVVVLISPDDDLRDLSFNRWDRIDSDGGVTKLSSNKVYRDFQGLPLNLNSLPVNYRLAFWSDSRLFMWLTGSLNRHFLGTDLSKGMMRSPLSEKDSFQRLVVTLKALRKLIRENGSRLVIAVLPEVGPTGSASTSSRRIMELLKKLSIPRIDLSERIKPIQRNSEGEVRISREENDIIADAIFEYLREYDAKRDF